MKKPEPQIYYDYWQVFRYLKNKYDLNSNIGQDFFNWMECDSYQNSIITLNINEYLPQHEEYGCDNFCPCKSVPETIQKFLILMKEFGEEIQLKTRY